MMYNVYKHMHDCRYVCKKNVLMDYLHLSTKATRCNETNNSSIASAVFAFCVNIHISIAIILILLHESSSSSCNNNTSLGRAI